MKKRTSKQSIYKRFKQFIILGTVAILTVCTTATATQKRQTLKEQLENPNKYTLYDLGKMYALGDGVTQDYKKAVKYLTQASEKGHATATAYLGKMYALGDGVKQDEKKAVALFTTAYEQSTTEKAFYNLGLDFLYGDGVTQDTATAIKWLEKSPRNKSAVLGIMYETGDGVKKDLKKAVEYYTQARPITDIHNFYKLGLMYELGQGVKQNLQQAFIFYFMASKTGNKYATARLEYLKLKIK